MKPKKVILIGDSIRLGYQPFVERALAGAADVTGPAENGGNSANVLMHLKEWVPAYEADVVHFNCGLHDLKRERGSLSDGPAIPLEEYAANLREILTRLKDGGDAAVIWATTTPVNEQNHAARKPFDRREADVDAYNQAALAVVNKFDVAVNDLYGIVEHAGRDRLLVEDGVHYMPGGYELLARQVAACIRDKL